MKSRAFSLLELLVAVALLAVVGLLIAQIVSATMSASRLSNQGVDAAAQARLAFDRIGMDLAAAIVRSDTDFQASATNATNLLTVLASVASADPAGAPSDFSNRMISLVSYRVALHPDNGNRPCLARAGRAAGWGERGFMGIPASATNTDFSFAASDPAQFSSAGFPLVPAAGEFDIVAPAVIHALIGFQLRPDGRPAMLENGVAIARAAGQIVYSPPLRDSSRIDPSRIAALVVGLVVVDPEKLRAPEFGDPSVLAALAGAFDLSASDLDDASAPLPVAKWMKKTGDLASLPASVPPPLRQSVRLYQRFFPIMPHGGES